MENYCPDPLCEYSTMSGRCTFEKGCAKANTEILNIKTNEDMHIQRYSVEPFYGQRIEDNRNTFNYILRIPNPLDSEQIKAILMVIKEMRSPRDYTSDKIAVVDWRKHENEC